MGGAVELESPLWDQVFDAQLRHLCWLFRLLDANDELAVLRPVSRGRTLVRATSKSFMVGLTIGFRVDHAVLRASVIAVGLQAAAR
jgi:hypothetical protein